MIKKFNEFINEMHNDKENKAIDSSYLSDECQMAFDEFIMDNDLSNNDYVDSLYKFLKYQETDGDPNGWVDEIRSEYEINIDGTVYPNNF